MNAPQSAARATVIGIVALAGALAGAPAARAGGGAVAGAVTTARKAPAAPLPVTPAHHGPCGKDVPDETLIVRDGKVANAVVWIEGVPGPAAPGHAEVSQQRCRYAPHVQAVTAGSSLTLKNGDATLHNVHAYLDGKRTLFNLAMPFQGHRIDRKLDKSGIVSLKCDAGHVWMSAWIHVFDHPHHAVTGADGAFRIDGLPPGTHTLRVWHETLGDKTLQVTVPDGGAAKADVSL